MGGGGVGEGEGEGRGRGRGGGGGGGGGGQGLNLLFPLPFNPGPHPIFVGSCLFVFFSIAKYCAILHNFPLFLLVSITLGIWLPAPS